MTSPRSATSRRKHPHGFTLIELLVIIGIIALLAAFAVPMLHRAWRQGVATKTKADFQVISVALEAFKADAGDYPRVTAINTGFVVLGKELVGPYGDGKDSTGALDPTDPPVFSASKPYRAGDAVRNPGSLPVPGQPNNTYVCLEDSTGIAPSGNNQYWWQFDVNDGKDGPGTSVRAGGAPRGPYLQPDRFKMRGCALLDPHENPILYFPASLSKPNINVAPASGAPPFVSKGSKLSVFDAWDNAVFFMSGADTVANPNNAYSAICAMLGDTNGNGVIDSDKGEAAVTTGPYILWAAGEDGVFGPVNKGQSPFPTKTDVNQCDDVTNFK